MESGISCLCHVQYSETQCNLLFSAAATTATTTTTTTTDIALLEKSIFSLCVLSF
jgi:hypothetical protein